MEEREKWADLPESKKAHIIYSLCIYLVLETQQSSLVYYECQKFLHNLSKQPEYRALNSLIGVT